MALAAAAFLVGTHALSPAPAHAFTAECEIEEGYLTCGSEPSGSEPAATGDGAPGGGGSGSDGVIYVNDTKPPPSLPLDDPTPPPLPSAPGPVPVPNLPAIGGGPGAATSTPSATQKLSWFKQQTSRLKRLIQAAKHFEWEYQCKRARQRLLTLWDPRNFFLGNAKAKEKRETEVEAELGRLGCNDS